MMKTLTNYIKERLTAKSWNKFINNEITLEEIENAPGGSSFMDDRSWAVLDNVSYEKIGKNKWQRHSNSSHALVGTISDKEFFEAVKGAKEAVLHVSVIIN